MIRLIVQSYRRRNHLNHIHANNRAEVSHQQTRQQEWAMRGFHSLTKRTVFHTPWIDAKPVSFRPPSDAGWLIIGSCAPNRFRFGMKRCAAKKRCHRSASTLPFGPRTLSGPRKHAGYMTAILTRCIRSKVLAFSRVTINDNTLVPFFLSVLKG